MFGIRVENKSKMNRGNYVDIQVMTYATFSKKLLFVRRTQPYVERKKLYRYGMKS